MLRVAPDLEGDCIAWMARKMSKNLTIFGLTRRKIALLGEGGNARSCRPGRAGFPARLNLFCVVTSPV